MNLPQHIAIIPDGNRRWAKQRGILASLGHEAGNKTAENIIRALREKGVVYASFWGCSVGNVTKRETKEVQFLYQLFKSEFERLLNDPETYEKKVRVRVLGEWETYFPRELQAVIREVVEKTVTHDGFHLTFLMAYSGAEEMLSAIRSIKADAAAEAPRTWGDVKRHLYTKDLPAVDLVIRTGNEPHASEGFMMGDTLNAQYYFSECMWPDFTPEELDRAFVAYAERERRLGK